MSKQPAIRFIIKTLYSRPDSSGNRYSFSIVTSTKSGRSLSFYSGYGGGNAVPIVRRVAPYWPEYYDVSYTLPIREWEANKHNLRATMLTEDDVTDAMLLALERRTPSPRRKSGGDVAA